MTKVVVVGSLNVDQISYTPKLPEPGETILGTRYEIGCGGKGANQAVQCARLGTSTKMIGAVGDDANGEMYLTQMKKEGIDISSIKVIENMTTGVAPIFVSEKTAENCIVVIPGANNSLSVSDVGETIEGDVLVCQNEIRHEVTRHALRVGKRCGLKTVYSTAPAPSCEQMREIAPEVDILLANEIEALDVTGVEEGVEEAARKLHSWGVGTVIITQGSKGYSILADDKFEGFEAKKVNAVDTTGAGDSFVGGLVHGLVLQDGDLHKAAKFAAIVAAKSVTKNGTQKSYPCFDELDDF